MKKVQICVQAFVFLVFGFAAQGVCEPSYTLKQLCQVANEKKAVILESKQSFLEFNTAKSTLTNLADEVKSAEENFNAVRMQFKYGMADSIDIMDANTLLVDAQRRISNARSSFYLSILKIIYTQGEILDYFLTEE